VIRFEHVPEPPSFDEEVRKPGNAWLTANPEARSERMPPLWSRCRKHLATGFQNVCGYSAMWTQRGTVDHYRSRSSREGRALAYEWDNYRFASEEMNSAKGILKGLRRAAHRIAAAIDAELAKPDERVLRAARR